MRLIVDATEVERFRSDALRLPAARRFLLTNLAVQAEGHALDLARGGEAAGDYPIPVRSGRFRGAFGTVVNDHNAVLYNEAGYARALHEGYRPYGNPNAAPIPARPYFADALDRVDVDAAFDAWAAQFVNAGGAA